MMRVSRSFAPLARRLSVYGVGFATLLASSAGLASLSYPTVLLQNLNLPAARPCVLCHTTETGGAGTVTRPFGITMMRTLGLVGNNDAALIAAIRANIYDTDQDGVADIQELQDGSDPNVKDRMVEPPPPPPGDTGGGSGGAGGDTGATGGDSGTVGGETSASAGSAGEAPEDPPQSIGKGGDTGATPSPPPTLPPPPPPPPGGANLPMRETGCALSSRESYSSPSEDGLLALFLLLAARHFRRHWQKARSGARFGAG